jgi:hypothetical protein
MDPIYPWLDPVEVKRLAESLLKPLRQPNLKVADAGFDSGFVGYATGSSSQAKATVVVSSLEIPALVMPSPAHDLSSDPFAVTDMSSPAPPVLEPAPAPVVECVVAPPVEETKAVVRVPFQESVIRFRDWMRENFAATGIFILDREGEVLFEDGHQGRLHFLARSLAIAPRSPSVGSGNVHVKIGAGAMLEIIPVDSPHGRMVLGVVVPEALVPSSVGVVMDALSQIASLQSSP